MVSVLKLVDGKVETQQPVSNGLITNDEDRRTDGLHRGQDAIRSMENVLTSVAFVTNVSYVSTTYDTELEVFNDGKLICKYVIAMRDCLEGPWYPWGNNTWDRKNAISV